MQVFILKEKQAHFRSVNDSSKWKKGVKGELQLKGMALYLSVSPDSSSTVAEQLRHVVVAGEFPQTSL